MDYSKEIEKYRNNKDSFDIKTLREDDDLLNVFGIHIPGRDFLPQVFYKLYPSDFIVEEIGNKGEVCTIDKNTSLDDSGLDIVGVWEATLVKCNIGTHDAVIEIANILSIPVENIQYAGLKDEFAITAQKITVKNVKGIDLLNVKTQNYFIKEVRKTETELKKGNLKGNRFTILLRFPSDQVGKGIAVDTAIKNVGENGFYNFYYLQRFGLPRLNNHYIGGYILHGDYENALKAHLCDIGFGLSEEEVSIRKKAEETFGNWQEMKKIFEVDPKSFQYELEVVEYLIKNPEDIKGALKTIPHIVMLWVYSLSSWMFNNQLSFISDKGSIPHKLPLVLSNNQRDIDFYKFSLSKIAAYPPRWENIKQVMPELGLQSRLVDTKADVVFNKIEKVSQGIIVSFDLGKGSYATTLLAHLVNLISYAPPTTIDFSVVDTKKHIQEGSISELECVLIDIYKPIFTEKYARI